MSHPLQEFDFRHSTYERPNQKWVCGWTAQGQPCHVGPDRGGHCQAHRECLPVEGADGYTCARPKDWGGKCKGGPNDDGTCPHQRVMCQPQRSLFGKRRMLTLLTTWLAVGSLLLMFGGRHSGKFVSPGDLTSHHHNQNCHECHTSERGHEKTDTSAVGILKSWLHGSVTQETMATSGEQSRLCLKCHDYLGNDARHTHNLPPEDLDKITARIAQDNSSDNEPFLLSMVSSIGPAVPMNENREMACSTCHKDHRGQNFNPTQLTNDQCQKCHNGRFHSFSDGHPPLGDYPHKRRTRIYFDHVQHLKRHFVDFKRIMPNGAELRCADCHRTEPSGQLMVVRGFEQACASCHAGQIGNSLVPGLAVYNLPAIDLDTLKQKAINVGQWPAAANFAVLDGKVTPFVELLLTESEESAGLIRQIQAINLRDLTGASDEQLKLVEDYVWAVKSVLHDLIRRDRDALEKRLQTALGANADPSQLVHLSILPPAQITELVSRWFPNLSAEMESRHNGQPVETETLIDENSPTILRVPFDSVGWYFDDWDLSIRYRPSEHADSFVRTWMDVSCRSESTGDISRDSDEGQATDAEPVERPLTRNPLSRIFAELAQVTTTGHCMKCHTLDQDAGGLHVNWHAVQHNMEVKKFSKFSHKPHITFLDEHRCDTCHELDEPLATEDPESLYRPQFLGADWHLNRDATSKATSGLHLIQDKCAECHTRQKSGDRCLQCHNYHVGHFVRMK